MSTESRRPSRTTRMHLAWRRWRIRTAVARSHRIDRAIARRYDRLVDVEAHEW